MNQLTSPLLELLKDVGRFVSHTLSKEILSEKARDQRQRLVQRLSLHLPETFPPTTSPPYLDMTSTQAKGLVQVSSSLDGSEYVGTDNQEYEEQEYEECPEPQRLVTIVPTPPPYPKAAPALPREDSLILQIAYSEIRMTSPKSGPLHRRERVFFIDQFRRYYVALLDHKLCFYGSDRDMKPCNVLSLEGFQARPAPHIMKDQRKKEKDYCFEIICPGRKTSQLMARTPKDMEQWVAVICMAGRQPTTKAESPIRRRQLPSIPDDNTSEEMYDDIQSLNLAKKRIEPLTQLVPEEEEEEEGEEEDKEEEEENDDEIYHDISVVLRKDSDQESLYDDIGTFPTNVYYNTDKDVAKSKPPVVPKPTTKRPLPHPPTEPEEIEEDIYDDIETLEATIAPLKKPPLPTKELSSVSKVQAMALSLQGTLNRAQKKNFLPHKPPTPVQTEELYELVDNPQLPERKETIRPTLPMKSNLVR